MAEPWFRMHAQIADKPVIWRLMQTLDIPMAQAVGHMAMFWGAVSRTCPGGIVSDVPDIVLERWAQWSGAPGMFATFVRKRHVDEDGRVREYEEYCGALDDRRDYERERKALQRQKAREERQRKLVAIAAELRGYVPGNPPQEVPDLSGTNTGTDGGTSLGTSDPTKRDDTKRDEVNTTNNSINNSGEAEDDSGFRTARDEVSIKLPLEFRTDLDRFVELIRAKRDSSHASRKLAWMKSILYALNPEVSPHYSGEVMGLTLRDCVAKGEEPNSAFFRGMCEKNHNATKSAGTTGVTQRRGGATAMMFTRDLEAHGAALWADLVAGIHEVYIKEGDGGYYAKKIRQEVLDKLPVEAKKALDAIGGVHKVATVKDDQRPYLAGQFGKIYAGAVAVTRANQ